MELDDLASCRYVSPYGRVLIYLGLGDDRVFEWLARSHNERAAWLMYLATDPRFDPLREDTRFRSFLQKLGLPLIAYPAPIPSRAGTVWNRSYWRISAEAVQTYLEHYVANRCSETLSNFGL